MTLSIGLAKVNITPKVGVELCGHGFYCERKSTGVMEPIYVRALSWRFDFISGVIIAPEVLCISGQWSRKIKEMVQINCGIPSENIMISCLHNHAAPSTCDMLGYGEQNDEYIAEFIRQCARAADDAYCQMKPSTLEYVEVPVQGIGINREVIGGETDPYLRVVRIRTNSKLVAFIANYACHPVVMNRGTSLVCSDFTGVALNKVCARHGLSGLFLQGACGDINSIYVNCPQDQAINQLHQLSEKFADYLEQAILTDRAEQLTINCVGMTTRNVDLPFQKPDRWLLARHLKLVQAMAVHAALLPDPIKKELLFEKEACEQLWQKIEKNECSYLSIEMQALRLGDFIVIAQPSELFYCYQRELFDRFQGYRLMMAGYSNDYIGYIPTADRFDSYTAVAYWVPFVLRLPSYTRDVGSLFLQQMIEIIEAIIETDPNDDCSVN